MTDGLFKVDYLDGEVVEWYATPKGVEPVSNPGYTPTIYAIPDGDLSFEDLADLLDPHPLVVDMASNRGGEAGVTTLNPSSGSTCRISTPSTNSRTTSGISGDRER